MEAHELDVEQVLQSAELARARVVASVLGTTVAQATERKVLLVGDADVLVRAMAQEAATVPGISVAGSFRSQRDLNHWLLWDGAEWDMAFVDFATRAIAPQLISALASHPQRGAIHVLGDPDWPDLVAVCKTLGADRVLKRGDLTAFKSVLEEATRH